MSVVYRMYKRSVISIFNTMYIHFDPSAIIVPAQSTDNLDRTLEIGCFGRLHLGIHQLT